MCSKPGWFMGHPEHCEVGFQWAMEMFGWWASTININVIKGQTVQIYDALAFVKR